MNDPGTILVSGVSRGLGLSLAEHLLSRGLRVAGFARGRTDAVERVAKRNAGRFFFEERDARDLDAMEAFVRACTESLGAIGGLVNNAAIGQDHLFSHLPPETISEIIEINLRAPVLLTRLVVREMLLGGRGGRIINISSICASHGYAGLTVYSATKGAIEALTRSLARELGSRDILVNAVAPGFFESEMSQVLRADQVDAIRRRTPTGRLVETKDLLPVVEMLLLSETNLTGQVIHVDGGASA